jgi:hypothetical protein
LLLSLLALKAFRRLLQSFLLAAPLLPVQLQAAPRWRFPFQNSQKKKQIYTTCSSSALM